MKKTILDYILKVRVPVIIFVALTAFLITYYISRPYRDGVGYSPDQPINFSHKLHAGQMSIDCQYCHIGVEKSRHATIPSTNVCMNCHTIVRKDKPEIIKLTKYFHSNKPVPWNRIHKVPDYAYFNHSFHVNRGINCEDCHGDVKSMDKIKQVEPFTMGDCLDCHKKAEKKLSYIKDINNGPTHCSACHR